MILDSKDEQTVGADPGDSLTKAGDDAMLYWQHYWKCMQHQQAYARAASPYQGGSRGPGYRASHRLTELIERTSFPSGRESRHTL